MNTQLSTPGQELDRKVQKYMDKRGCDYASGLRAVTQANPELARRYSRGEEAETGRTDLDAEIQGYMQTHPGVTYLDAWRALYKEAQAKGQETVKEYGRRVTAYQEHFRVGPEKAKQMVEDHDPKMRLASYETTASGELVGLVNALIGANQPRLGFKEALLQTARANPDLIKQVAGDELVRRAQTWMSKQTLAQGDRGDSNAQMQRALREIGRLPENAAIVQMWSTGVPTIEGLDAIFPQWHLTD